VGGWDKPDHDGGDGKAGHWIAIPAHTLHQGDSSLISRAIPHADCGRVSLTYGWTKPFGLKQRLKSGAPYGRSGAATEIPRSGVRPRRLNRKRDDNGAP
jgi:hypothetical protein